MKFCFVVISLPAFIFVQDTDMFVGIFNFRKLCIQLKTEFIILNIALCFSQFMIVLLIILVIQVLLINNLLNIFY